MVRRNDAVSDVELAILRAAIELCTDEKLRNRALRIVDSYTDKGPAKTEWTVPHVMEMYKE